MYILWLSIILHEVRGLLREMHWFLSIFSVKCTLCLVSRCAVNGLDPKYRAGVHANIITQISMVSVLSSRARL